VPLLALIAVTLSGVSRLFRSGRRETVFAGIFGYWLAGDRLGWLGWGGCAVIVAGIAVAEPAAAATLLRLVARR
jgi:drug/metabolite transporter (DMT)-like permease